METNFKQEQNTQALGITIFSHNQTLDLGCGYVSYNYRLGETAIVLKALGIEGAMYLIIDGDHRKEVLEIIQKYSDTKFNNLLFGAMVCWACQHKDLNIERCQIGDACSKLGFREIKPLI